MLRLRHAGLRVDEVPVHMRDRAIGTSRLRGRRALELVVTVVGVVPLLRALASVPEAVASRL